MENEKTYTVELGERELMMIVDVLNAAAFRQHKAGLHWDDSETAEFMVAKAKRLKTLSDNILKLVQEVRR